MLISRWYTSGLWNSIYRDSRRTPIVWLLFLWLVDQTNCDNEFRQTSIRTSFGCKSSIDQSSNQIERISIQNKIICQMCVTHTLCVDISCDTEWVTMNSKEEVTICKTNLNLMNMKESGSCAGSVHCVYYRLQSTLQTTHTNRQ